MQQTAMRTTITNQARRIAMLAAILLLPALAHAQTYTVAPQTFGTVLDDSGRIVVGGCVWTYAAGTTTQIATYSNSTGTLNANPIVADYAGRYTAFLIPGTNYKFVYENVPCSSSTHGTVLRTADNIAGNPASSASVDVIGTAGETIGVGQVAYLSDGSGGKQTGQWFKADSANVYSSTQPELGLAISAFTSGSQGTIRLAGGVSGLASLTIGGSYYVGTSGALTATAPANRRLIGVADTATSLVVLPTPAASQLVPGTSIITTTGTQTALAIPSGSGPLVIYANNATLLTIQGITAGIDGQRLTIYSIGAGQVDAVHQSGSASAALRLINIATSLNTSLAPGSGVFDYEYDATTARWRLLTHFQGAGIAYTPGVTFGGAAVGVTYTTQSGSYTLRGRDMIITGRLTLSAKGSSVGAAAISLPIASANNGFYGSAAMPFFGTMVGLTNLLMGYIAPNATTISLQTGGAANSGAVADTNFANTSDIVFNAVYAVS